MTLEPVSVCSSSVLHPQQTSTSQHYTDIPAAYKPDSCLAYPALVQSPSITSRFDFLDVKQQFQYMSPGAANHLSPKLQTQQRMSPPLLCSSRKRKIFTSTSNEVCIIDTSGKFDLNPGTTRGVISSPSSSTLEPLPKRIKKEYSKDSMDMAFMENEAILFDLQEEFSDNEINERHSTPFNTENKVVNVINIKENNKSAEDEAGSSSVDRITTKLPKTGAMILEPKLPKAKRSVCETQGSV